MKRILKFIVLLAVICAFCITVFSATDCVASISGAKAAAGSEIELTVSVKRSPGIAAASFSIGYDSDVMTYIGSESANDYLLVQSSEEAGTNPVKLVFLEFSLSDVSGNFSVAKIKFKIADDAPAGLYDIDFSVDEAYNYNEDDVPVVANSSTVEVAEPGPGDVNGDCDVNIRDVTVILQKIAGWEVSINEDFADVNNDGSINIRDVTLILQKIAGWDVTLGGGGDDASSEETVIVVKSNDKSIYIDDEDSTVSFPPLLVEDELFVIVSLAEELFELDELLWDESSSTVTFKKGETTVEMTEDSTKAYINSEENTLPVAPSTINTRFYVPLEFIATAFGAEYEEVYAQDGDSMQVEFSFEGMDINIVCGTMDASVNRSDITLAHAPILVEGEVLVSVRTISDYFDIEIFWDTEAETLTLGINDTEILMSENSYDAYVDGYPVVLTAAPSTINGKLYIPIKFLAEILDIDAVFNNASDANAITATIKK